MTPPDVAKTQRQLKLVQWLNPLLSGAIVALGSWHEEQQRASQVVPGLLKGLTGRSPLILPAAAAVGFGVLASRRQKKRSTTVTAYPAPSLASRPPTSTTTTSQTTGPIYGANGTTGAVGTTSTPTTSGLGTTSTDLPPTPLS